MKANFMNAVKVSNPNSNWFDLSHDVKTSFRMGYLIPSPPIECVPGDKFKLGASSLIRFAPLAAPTMHRFDVRHEYFFVPLRLLWSNWEKWITQTEVAGDLPAYPTITIDQDKARPDNFKLLNYMGIPFRTGVAETETISAMPLAAYQFIYDQYYRDQNMIPSQPESFELQDGDNTVNLNFLATLRQRAWEHDYFTSCLPEAQKGDPVMIPIGSQRVILDPTKVGTSQIFVDRADFTTPLINTDVTTAGGGELLSTPVVGPTVAGVIDPNDTLITDDTGQATSINDLRLAYALQRVKEKLMRGGSRLTEFLRVMFGVTPQDARLDRPEYIGGVKTPVVISEVLQTSASDDLTTPQGNMAGHGVGVVKGNYASYYVQEHGYIICMTSVIPRTAYMQGINKTWLRYNDPTEYYLPDMASIGEQTVKNKEVFAFQGASGEDDFGYQARYGEYKTMQSWVTGDFQTSLLHWHDARVFGSVPALDDYFVNCNPDPRIFAVTDDNVDQIYAHLYHDVSALRKMPKFGTPTY